MDYDITFIGHMCLDEIIPCGGRPTVAPGVKMSPRDEAILEPMRKVGVHTVLVPAEETTYSRVLHETENVDERKLTLVKSAGLISIEAVPPLDSRCVHLAGISDTEFDMALIRGLKARGYSLSTDMQSFVRQVDPV